MNHSSKLVLFQSKQIRRIWHDEEWWFSVTDIVAALTDSTNSRDYWYKMKIREEKESKIQLSTICLQLKLDGMPANKKIANRGGGVAGKARKDTEKELGRSVISKDSQLSERKEKKKLK